LHQQCLHRGELQQILTDQEARAKKRSRRYALTFSWWAELPLLYLPLSRKKVKENAITRVRRKLNYPSIDAFSFPIASYQKQNHSARPQIEFDELQASGIQKTAAKHNIMARRT
jgi:hypothetical protein